MWISLLLDGVIAILLGVTIFYCILVNRRLAALRSGKDELKQVIEDLTVATTNAQMSISHLKEAGRDIVSTLEEDVRKGRALADELSLMVEAGNNLANRLEGGRERATMQGASEPAREHNDLRGLETAVEELKLKGQATSKVRARVQVQAAAHASEKANTKSANIESGVENELLKALRRAR